VTEGGLIVQKTILDKLSIYILQSK